MLFSIYKCTAYSQGNAQIPMIVMALNQTQIRVLIGQFFFTYLIIFSKGCLTVCYIYLSMVFLCLSVNLSTCLCIFSIKIELCTSLTVTVKEL